MKQKQAVNKETQSVRLDKWLWAARFFKTRALARAAIEGGKVEIDGIRAKPGKAVHKGLQLMVRAGFDRKHIIVEELLGKRSSATVAETLYRETEESLSHREQAIAQRKLASAVIQHDQKKPAKHQRRQMQQFKRNQ